MTPAEKLGVTELNISPIPEGMKTLPLGELLDGFSNLRTLEISDDFKGMIERDGLRNEPKIEVFKATGAIALGNALFNEDWASELRELHTPGVKVIEMHCFGSSCDNRLTSLDFPNVRCVEGLSFIGCKDLRELKFGSDEPISMGTEVFAGYFGKVNTENIILYLGKYEYENNVDGNTWNACWYPASGRTSEDLEGEALIANTRWNEPKPSGPLKFKEIRRY